MHPVDEWRKCLPNKLKLVGSTGADIHYLNIQAMAYRLECILCRLIRRSWQEWSEWAKQRLQSALLELDTIARRVLANGNIHEFPITL